MKFKITDVLRCQYCGSGLSSYRGFKQKDNFKIVRCNCDEYPIIYNLVILIKDDSQLNKRIVKSLIANNIYKAVWQSLSGLNYVVKSIIFAAFFLSKRYGIQISQLKLLRVLKIFSQNKTWFDYLIHRDKAKDFKLASNLLSDSLQGIVIDIGCGTGRFIKQITRQSDTEMSIVGFDKSIVSLLIAAIYNRNDNILFVLADLEQGIPLYDQVASTVFFLDSFPWIYNKIRICKETARVLIEKGALYIFNVFSPAGKAKDWGYGIYPRNLKSILSDHYRHVRLVNYPYGTYGKEINLYGYNVLAKKK